jgi:hypothetical protein
MEVGGQPAVISRFQAVLFVVLLAASGIMGVALWRQLERAHERMVQGKDSAPTQAPQIAPEEQATLLVANDQDNSLLAQVQTMPLPQDPGSRARVILGKLLDLYAAPGATHPVPGGASSANPADAKSADAEPRSLRPSASAADTTGPLLAVVNLTPGFAASHPSGIETETLTILSICGTLHANLPRVTQVRFLVDGLPRPTLAGHADLTRTYLAAEAVPTEGAHP